MWPGSILLAFATLGIPAGSAEENSSPTAVLQSASSDPALVGEMAGFRSLVDQINVTFEKGQSIASSTDRNLEPSIPQTVELQEKVPAANWETNDWYAAPRSPAFNDLFGS